MSEPQIHYDELSDALYVTFVPGESATGIELNENILLRIDQRREIAIGLTLFNFSLLAQRTEMGPRSFPLAGLKDLPGTLRESTLNILLKAPVSDFLSISAYTPATDASELVPITSVHSDRFTTRAA